MIFFHETEFENVILAAILSQPECVDQTFLLVANCTKFNDI